jgi:hypothetical protein
MYVLKNAARALCIDSSLLKYTSLKKQSIIPFIEASGSKKLYTKDSTIRLKPF